jgi:8-oxo-dGTP pyrophosphatase MutT (NUDIX family)
VAHRPRDRPPKSGGRLGRGNSGGGRGGGARATRRPRPRAAQPAPAYTRSVPDRAWFLSRFYRVAYQLARVYWFVAQPKKRGVKCLLTRGDEVLLVRHTYGDRGAWDLPGGSIKRGEAPLEAARREIHEELGLEISDWVELGDFFAKYEHRKDTMYCFHASVDGVKPVADRIEIAEVRWFPAAALPQRNGRFVRRILAMSRAAAAANAA